MLLKLLHHLLKSCVKPGLLLERVLKKGNSLISWKDKRGWENLCLVTASATEVVNTEVLAVVKGTVTLVMEKWKPGNCFSGVTWEWAVCSSWRISSCWGIYWSFLKHWSPVRQPPHPEMGDWGTELGAACFLVASDFVGLYGLTLPSGFMMLSHEPSEEVQSAPFLRGFMWVLGFSGMRTSCVFRLKALCWCRQPELYLWHLLALKHQEKMERAMLAVPCISGQERQRNVSELFWVNGTVKLLHLKIKNPIFT